MLSVCHFILDLSIIFNKRTFYQITKPGDIMSSKKYALLIGAFVIAAFAVIIAQNFRPEEIPNGLINQCLNCHITPEGGTPRNAFGLEIENGFLTVPGPSGHVKWGPDLASLDSDGDGFTNGEELQDPNGEWTIGSGPIGDQSLVTLPGDPDSHPETTSVDRIESESLPHDYVLEQNYPNPFNPSTVINFSVAKQSNVSLTIFNSLGQFVEELVNEELPAGSYNVQWRAVNLASGVYYYTLSAPNFRESKKMILIK